MKNLNINPKGIKTGDCVIRAIAYATEQNWDTIYKALCELGLKMKRLPNDKKVFHKYLDNLGWVKHKQPKEVDYENGFGLKKKKYTIEELMQRIEIEHQRLGVGKVIVSMPRHLTCIEPQDNWKYEIVDIWDCSNKKVGNYWTKGGK